METLITRPIENAVSRVNGIQQINSSSSEGNTRVTAQFYFGTNIDTAAVDVQEQVSRIWGTASQRPQPPAAGHHEIRFELAAGRAHVRDRLEHDAPRPRRFVHQPVGRRVLVHRRRRGRHRGQRPAARHHDRAELRRARRQRNFAPADHAARRPGEHQPSGRHRASREERVPRSCERAAAIGAGDRAAHRHDQKQCADPARPNRKGQRLDFGAAHVPAPQRYARRRHHR